MPSGVIAFLTLCIDSRYQEVGLSGLQCLTRTQTHTLASANFCDRMFVAVYNVKRIKQKQSHMEHADTAAVSRSILCPCTNWHHPPVSCREGRGQTYIRIHTAAEGHRGMGEAQTSGEESGEQAKVSIRGKAQVQMKESKTGRQGQHRGVS